MHAAVFYEFGGPEVLRYESVPDPVVPPGWVLVRIEASALNWHDVLVRQGQYASPLPHVMGADGAGLRIDDGQPVMILPSLGWGDRRAAPSPEWQILGDRISGTYGELVAVPEDCVIPRPKGFDLIESAALPLVGVTVYRALVRRGRLRAGESVLILGAAGGVATMATAMAAAAGARVFVTSGDPQKLARAVELGALGGLDHNSDRWTDEALAVSPGGDGFDLVLDSVGRCSESVRCLRPGGRCVVLGSSVATEAKIDVRSFYFGQYDLLGTTMGNLDDIRGLLHFISTERMAPPPIDTVMAVPDAAKAHARLESGAGFGKIVMRHG